MGEGSPIQQNEAVEGAASGQPADSAASTALSPTGCHGSRRRQRSSRLKEVFLKHSPRGWTPPRPSLKCLRRQWKKKSATAPSRHSSKKWNGRKKDVANHDSRVTIALRRTAMRAATHLRTTLRGLPRTHGLSWPLLESPAGGRKALLSNVLQTLHRASNTADESGPGVTRHTCSSTPRTGQSLSASTAAITSTKTTGCTTSSAALGNHRSTSHEPRTESVPRLRKKNQGQTRRPVHSIFS